MKIFKYGIVITFSVLMICCRVRSSTLTFLEEVNNIPNLKAFAPIDWRTSNCVSDLNANGNMQNTIPLAIATAVESSVCIKTKSLPRYSIQQIIDCTAPTTNLPEYYEYDLAINGLFFQSDYPYVDKGPKNPCKASTLSGKPLFKVQEWEFPVPNFKDVNVDINSVYKALIRGPLVVGFNFYQELQRYTSGILTPTSSSNICAYYWWGVLVGYGVEAGKEYWIVKGYAGMAWGEKGFFRLARNDASKNYGINCGYRRPIV